MANIPLRCSCGYMFVVSPAQIGKNGRVPCPSCLRPVGLEGPSPGPAPRRKEDRVLTAAPDAAKLKMWAIVLGGGAVVVIAAIVLLLVSTGSGEKRSDSMDVSVYDSGLSPNRFKEHVPNPPPAPAPVPGAAPAPAAAPAPSGDRPLTVVGSAVQPGAPSTPVPSAIPPTAAAPGLSPLPPELLQQVRDDVLGLHPFYQKLTLTEGERARVESHAKSGQGYPDDVAFLKALLGGKVKLARDERAYILESLEKLQKEAIEGLPVDRLVLADGRVMIGRIVEETPELVKLERRTSAGVGGIMPFKREAVRAVEKGRGIGGEFKTKWDSAQKGSVADLSVLAGWCRDNSLALQLQLVAFKMLAADPGNAPARQDVGLPADPVARALEAEKQGGFITHLGRLWTPKELKEKLVRDGYFLLDGQWYQRKDRMISVPGLFKYERQSDKPVLISGGVPLSHDAVTTYSVTQEVTSNSFVEKEEVKYLRRFYSPALEVKTSAGFRGSLPGGSSEVEVQGKQDEPILPLGTPQTGDVFITVPVGEPIIEASVTTHAEVKPGGSITVYLIHNAERIRLYQCGAKEDGSHKLPDAVKGKSQVDLVAVVSSKVAFTPKVERRRVRGLKKDQKGYVIQRALDVVHNRLIPDYQAMLFPSNSNTIEVFRLKVTTGEPAPGLTKLFANAPPELLKTP